MKALGKFILITASLLFVTANHAATTLAPIPATELFQEGALSQFQFSPNGEYTSAAVNYPDGKGIAFYDKKTNEFQLIVRIAQTDWIKHYHWLDATHLFLQFGNDNVVINTIVTVQDDNGKLRFESKNLPKNGYLVGQLKGSPTQLLFATDVGRSHFEYQLYRVSIEQLIAGEFPKDNRIKDLLNTDNATRLVYSQESNQLISIRMDAETQQINVHYRHLDGAEWQPLFSFNPVEFDFSPQQFLADGSLAVLTNKKSDKMALYRFNVKTQELGELLYEHPRYDLMDADFVEGQLSSVSYLAHGRLEQQFFTVQQQQLQQQLSQYFPDEQWQLIASHAEQKLLLVFSATNPGQYFFYQSGQPPQLIGSTLPELTKYQLAPSIKLQVKGRDHLEIESLLTLPVNRAKTATPLIVMPHGGPIGVQDTDAFDPTVQFLASRGYAVLRTNFRGSAGYGKSFSEKGVAALGEGIEQDIRTAVTQVRKQYDIGRACAMGYSYGGYSAMMLAISEPEFYGCVIAGFGIYDLPLLFNASNLKIQPEQRIRVERVIGPLTPALKTRSPVYLANKLQAPVLLIGGMEDDVAGFEQTHRMFDALKRAGKPVQEMFYQETGHGHNRWDLEHHQIGLIDQFLTQHLAARKKLTNAEQAEQWYRHAQLLEEGDKLGKDLAGAIKLYQQAAAFGHAASKVELAKALLNGEGLPQDLNKAIAYLQQAAAEDSAGAELLLGSVYSSGLYQPAEPAKANPHFSRAATLEPSSTAAFYIARASCLGLAQAVNWQGCLQRIEQQLKDYQQHYADSKTKQLKNAARRVIAELLLNGQPNSADRGRLIAILQSTLKAPIDTSAEITELRVGQYDLDRGKYSEESTYPRTSKNEFGSIIKALRADNSTGNKQTWLLVRWQRQFPDGRIQVIFDDAIPAALSEHLQLHSKLEYAMDQQAATWQLQVFDLHGKNLYQHQFVFQ